MEQISEPVRITFNEKTADCLADGSNLVERGEFDVKGLGRRLFSLGSERA
jgi:hypothetical protein